MLIERASTGFRRLRPQFCSIYEPYFWWHERFWKLSTQAGRCFNGTPFKAIDVADARRADRRRLFDDGATMSEKTLVRLGDDCTLNAGVVLQAHSMEDGVFKSDHIAIGSGVTLGAASFVHYGDHDRRRRRARARLVRHEGHRGADPGPVAGQPGAGGRGRGAVAGAHADLSVPSFPAWLDRFENLTDSRKRGSLGRAMTTPAETPRVDPDVAALRAAGLRVTAPRRAVLAWLAEHPHSTADAIGAAVRAELGAVSTQAVYDVLAACVDAGLVRRIEPAGHPARFERRVADNHHHVVCRRCGATEDIDCVVGAAPCVDPSEAHGFVVDEAEVVFWGLCPACQGTRDGEPPLTHHEEDRS